MTDSKESPYQGSLMTKVWQKLLNIVGSFNASDDQRAVAKQTAKDLSTRNARLPILCNRLRAQQHY